MIISNTTNNNRQSITKSESSSSLKAEFNPQLNKWNQTQAEYPKHKCIHQLFEAQVETTPNAIALVTEQQQLTYRQLNQKANQLAHHLRQQGIKPELKIGISLERSLEMIVGLLGILKAGGTYLPLDPTYPQERLSYMLEDAQVSMLLTKSKWRTQLPPYSGKIINLDTDWDSIAQNNSENPDCEIKPDNLMYIIYTSGSTGKPKGVMITHQSICNELHWRQNTFTLTPEDKSLQTASFSFDPSVWQIFWPLCFGAQLVLAKPGGHQDSKYLVETIINYNITVVNVVPSLLRVLLEEPEISKCSCLKHVTCGGEALSKDLIDKFYQRLNQDHILYNFYGPTETAIDATYWECLRDSNYAIAPIGRPIGNAQIYILDEQLQPLPVGEPGELHIGGDGLARGYLNRPELTQQKFIANPFSSQPNSRLYKTGDLARYLPDGNIEFLGRIDHQVKIRGFRIELGEIEAKLREYPGLEQVVVIAREDEPGQKRLVAYFVSHSDSEVTPQELRSFLTRELLDYMIPAAFVQMEELPLNPNGKVNRLALPVPEQSCFPVTQEYVAPRTEIEQQIAQIWSQVLGLETVGIYDNFFELGGHSLLAAQAISRFRNLLKLELSISSFFESPTIASLATTVAKALEQKQIELPPIESLPRDRSFPLSFHQQDPWFITTLYPELPVYNENCTLRLGGGIDVAVLEKSFAQMILRHEILRTTFVLQEGKPVQIIHPAYPFKIKTIDLRNITESEREAEALSLATADLIAPFDLSKCPLMRATLIQLGDEDYRLFLAMHHLLLDGVSMVNVFLPELEIAYKALSEGKPVQLPELKVQYADFAAWQQQCLTETVFSNQLSYWQQKLADLPTLQLPSDRPRLPKSTLKGKRQCIFLSKGLTESIKSLSRKAGVTIFMTLTAAFNTLLYRYSGQEDIVMGSVADGHNQREIEGLMGNFLIPMVLRTDISGNPTFMELLQRVRQVTVEAYANQVPFDLLLETLKPERQNNSINPLCQVAFIIEPPISNDNLHAWTQTMSQLDIHKGISLFDLYVELDERPEGINGRIEYNTDLFDDATITRLISNFQTLLEGIVANPEQKVSQLSLLTKAERHQILVEWNNTKADYPKDKCIHQLFEEQVEKTPDAVALEFENQQLTYRELNQKANQLAHYLRSVGIGMDVLVGVCLEPSLEMIVGLLGILKAGGIYVPFDPNYPQARLDFMAADSQVKAFVTQESLQEKIASPQALMICLDRDSSAINRESVENLENHTTSDQPAYAIYTSGSTGKPKAVLGTIRGAINRLHWMWESIPFSTDEICCQKTSLNFVDHVAEIFAPILKGIPLVIIPENMRGDVSRLVSLLIEKKITRIVLVPSLLKAILEIEPQKLKELRELQYVFCSGESLSLSLAKNLCEQISSARLFNLYGSSEVAADVTYFEVNAWETQNRILQYFKPQMVRDLAEKKVPESHQKAFTEPGVSLEILKQKFQQSQLPMYPITTQEYYEKFSKEVLPYVIDTGSPKYIGHMTSALPDFMHDISKLISQLNQNLVKIETSKSLIFLEREAIAMLHRLFYSFSDEFYDENIQQTNRNLGLVTTGGTTANISALLCARNQGLLRKENSWELSSESIYQVLQKKGYRDIIIIGSQLMHYSFKKAASMLGLGTNNIVFIPQNDRGTLNLNLLREQICEYRSQKLYILALIGIAGTTETGEIDPLFELAEIAQEFGIHFHVDGAWGGPTMFSEKHKVKLQGIEQADSITICGHKQLYLPQGISVCLFKDPRMLNLVETTARYQAQQDTFDVGRFSIEGSRSALSLCLHAALQIIGKRGYEVLIDNGIDKAQYFSRLIALLEPFELMLEPALNIVNYRYIPQDLRAKAAKKALSDTENHRINQLNTQIQKEQFERGITFVSKTTLLNTAYGKGKEIVVFRTVLSNPNTTTADLHSVVEDQLRIANQIQAKNKEKLHSLAEQTIDSSEVNSAVIHQETIDWQLAKDTNPDLEKVLKEYLKKNTIPIGKPMTNTQVYILDRHGNLTPPGVIGELYVGGDGLAKGYLNRPELTQEKFIPNPFSQENQARLYKTGDLARWLPDGNIEFLGRIDEQVKIRGFRIELGEIKRALAKHPLVGESVVIVREDNVDDQRLVAYIVPNQNQTPTIDELRRFLEKSLPNYMLPSAFVMLNSLPLTPNGKVDRRSLPAPDQTKQQSEETFVSPRNDLEAQLTKIWEQVLGIQPISIKDNFFNLGGHSLLAVRLCAVIEQKFGQNLPLPTLFQAPTIAQLAQVMLQIGWSSTSYSVVPLKNIVPCASKPPLFCIYGIFLYYDLASHLSKDLPVYGIYIPEEAEVLEDGNQEKQEKVLTTVVDLATRYLKEIRKQQPVGPYFLAGESFGGIVAFEIAQQLKLQGEEVALLACFDSTPPQGMNKLALIQRLSMHLKNLLEQGPMYIVKKVARRINLKVNSQDEEINQPSLGDARDQIRKQAYKNYKPQHPYSGKITLFQAMDCQFGVEPQWGWKRLAAGGLDVHNVPGDHIGILKEPHVQVLAEKLQACIDMAQAVPTPEEIEKKFGKN